MASAATGTMQASRRNRITAVRFAAANRAGRTSQRQAAGPQFHSAAAANIPPPPQTCAATIAPPPRHPSVTTAESATARTPETASVPLHARNDEPRRAAHHSALRTAPGIHPPTAFIRRRHAPWKAPPVPSRWQSHCPHPRQQTRCSRWLRPGNQAALDQSPSPVIPRTEWRLHLDCQLRGPEKIRRVFTEPAPDFRNQPNSHALDSVGPLPPCIHARRER